MNILVTGGAGFIGSHIVDAYIAMGHKVVVLDNLSSGRRENIHPKAVFYQLDLLAPEVAGILEKEKIEVVNHHAAQISVTQSVKNPLEDARTNILGSLKLLESAIQNGVRHFIFASTGGAIYGEQDSFPANELHACRPISPYAIAKFSVENYLNFYRESHGLNSAILRYSNVYGPRQDPHGEAGVVAIFCEKLLQKQQPVIFGDGEQTRDFVAVFDVVRANVLALEKSLTGIYNISTGKETSVNELCRQITRLAGQTCSPRYDSPRKGELPRSVIDSTRFQECCEWKPATRLEEGLQKTFAFFARKAAG